MTCRVLSLVVLGTVLSGAVDAGEAELARARLVWADFDGDGLEDVYVVRPNGQDALFRNVGDGSFEDVTAHALPCVSCASIEVAWRDVDLDRRPDLLRLLVLGGVELLQNRGNGVFEDVTLAAGLERVTGASAARWLDYDADGRADLELTTESAPLVYHNRGDFLFEAVTFDEVGGTATGEAPTVRAIPGALDEEGGSPTDIANVPADGPTSGSRRADGQTAAALSGSLVDKVYPDPLVPGTPPVGPLEPRGDAVELQIPPFANRCAFSVKDTDSSDCVLVSTLPTLGDLYPISANLFVSTGGNVGIGTTSPTAKLDVAGTARVTDTLTLNPAGDQALDVSTGSIYKGGLLFAHTKGGGGNTALGRQALSSVTTGFANTASGQGALSFNTFGTGNTASGRDALYANTLGFYNTAIGYQALAANTIGHENTAIGVRALSSAAGSLSTATGFEALRSNTTGTRNTANGHKALAFNTGGENNTAIGSNALYWNTTGTNNTASGVRALYYNTTGHRNTAGGYYALLKNTTGSDNVANGYRALYANTTGSRNTANGNEALRSNTTGTLNTASGYRALFSNTTGTRNTASGASTLVNNTIGSRNTASGFEALIYNTEGTRNTASGFEALFSNTTGSRNTATGYQALSSNTTGIDNIAVGSDAGSKLTTGNDNIAIGNEGAAGEGATIRIGTEGTHTRAFIAGIRAVTTDNADAIPVLIDSKGQLGTVSSSRRFKQDIADMDDATARLLELRPVVFHYKQAQEVPCGEVPLEYGLIAEEVAEIFPDLVVNDEEGLPFTVKYHLLSAMLLNEVKKLQGRFDVVSETHVRELWEHGRELEKLRTEVTRLRALETRLASIESRTSPAPMPASASAESR